MVERLDPELVKYLGSKRISVEQMDTVSRSRAIHVLSGPVCRV